MTCLCSRAHSPAVGLLALRLAVGIVFIHHGWLKLADIAATTSFFASQSLPLAAALAWIVALVEFVGGLAVLLGVYTRTAAMLLAIVMIVALLFVHTHMPFGSAELPLTLLGASLALMGVGGGAWQLLKKECVCQKA